MKAVRFDRYGGIEVLRVVDVPVPQPDRGQVLVQVKAASINPGEAKIREGWFEKIWPATFPSGEGTDLAGLVAKVGPAVEGFTAGDEVIGFTDRRASHAEYVVVEAQNLTTKPAKVPWEVAGLAGLVASGELEVPIAATFPLEDVRAAFELLEQGHTQGKIVLLPGR